MIVRSLLPFLPKAAVVRHSSRSALLVSGRNRSKQFAAFAPNLHFTWVKEHRLILERVALERGEAVEVEELLSGLQRYQELKASVVQLGQKREKLAALVKLKKKTKEKVEETVVLETRRVKESIEQLKEEVWRLEENELRRLLDLQNCDETSVFESRLIAFKKYEGQPEEVKLSHREVGVKYGLVTFTEDGGYYLHHKLALLELQLSHHLSSLALRHNHFPVSAPDFSKSVVLEGCGLPYFDPNIALALRPDGECGDPESGTAMHLVGGASLPGLVAYFARNVLASPGTVLPLVLSCQGRAYTPPTPSPVTPDLVTGRQSTAMASLAACASKEEAEAQFEKLVQFVQEAIQFMPNYRLEEQTLAQCSKSDLRRVSVLVRGKESIEVGSVALQGDYFSRRLMIRQKAEDDSLQPLYTASMQLSITRLLASIIEMSQGDSDMLAKFKALLA